MRGGRTGSSSRRSGRRSTGETSTTWRRGAFGIGHGILQVGYFRPPMVSKASRVCTSSGRARARGRGAARDHRGAAGRRAHRARGVGQCAWTPLAVTGSTGSRSPRATSSAAGRSGPTAGPTSLPALPAGGAPARPRSLRLHALRGRDRGQPRRDVPRGTTLCPRSVREETLAAVAGEEVEPACAPTPTPCACAA